MSYEQHWLERVDSMLKKSKKQAYVDVGDICDEIMASYLGINKFPPFYYF